MARRRYFSPTVCVTHWHSPSWPGDSASAVCLDRRLDGTYRLDVHGAGERPHLVFRNENAAMAEVRRCVRSLGGDAAVITYTPPPK